MSSGVSLKTRHNEEFSELSDRELLERIVKNQDEILKAIMFLIRLLTK